MPRCGKGKQLMGKKTGATSLCVLARKPLFSSAMLLFSGLSVGMRENNGVKKKKRYGGFEEVVIMDMVAWGGHVVSAWSATTCLGLCKPRR
jgi:hypothetical protein